MLRRVLRTATQSRRRTRLSVLRRRTDKFLLYLSGSMVVNRMEVSCLFAQSLLMSNVKIVWGSDEIVFNRSEIKSLEELKTILEVPSI